MDVMIHACPQRMWYVEKYLAPDLEKQFQDVMVWNDKNMDGCLASFLKACVFIEEKQSLLHGIWHIQDDVFVCSDFGERANALKQKNIVVNGFVGNTSGQVNGKYIGLQPVEKYWFSFPCIYIPNRYIRGFLDWFSVKCIKNGIYSKQVKENKYDDFLFWKYMREENKTDYVFNAFPNLVQNIDDIIGGSIINKGREKKLKSLYFFDTMKEAEIKQSIGMGDSRA